MTTSAIRLRRVLLLLWLGLYAQWIGAAPKIEHWVAPSGARVFFVENQDLPMLDVQIDFDAGSVRDPGDKPGVASLASGLLDLGVQGMDETQIANRLADLGAILSSGADIDRASLHLRTLSADDNRLPALELMRSVLVSPQFPVDVFEREKARTIAALKEASIRPENIAARTFWTLMYPAHPYGRNITPESVAAIGRDDLAEFHRQHYTAEGASVTVVGDVSREQAEILAQDLTADLPSGGAGELDVPRVLPLAAPVERRITHPAAQAHVLIGLPALKRGAPDFFALAVGNYTLGSGGFVSRLMKEVREKRGLAYSVSSHFMPLSQPGPFQISLQTKKAQADEALRVVREVLQRFITSGPTEVELRAAKQNLIGSFPLRLDSNGKILDNVALIGFYGLPLDYLDRYAENVEKVTAADIKAAFARHISPERMVTVVVGGEQ
jgi:zinc protease